MQVQFESNHFAKGRFRLAYKGTYTAGPKKGRKCVVKENKESYTWNSTDWDTTTELQKKAQKLAQEFNSEGTCNKSIKFVDVEVGCVTQSPTGKPKLNEYVVVEDYIPGSYTKWCNNYGYISGDSILMPAFMHWSWIHTGGSIMIADLQGVKSDMKYTLTDPVLMSNTAGGKYGCTDTGVEGIAMFFLRHTCNDICKGLPKPTPQDVGSTPADAQRLLASIGTSTAYSHELKFPQNIKQKMITRFPRIATRERI